MGQGSPKGGAMTMPVVVRLQGGLGNQLFQAAFSLALSQARSCDVYLDDAFFVQKERRAYGLSAFAHSWKLADQQMVRAARGWPDNRIGQFALRVISRIRGHRWTPRTWFVEQEGVYRPDVLSSRGITYLEGYWQDSRYHSGLERKLTTAFALASQPPPEVTRLAANAVANPSVMVHVRRGDYASDPAIRAFHGVLGAEYYGSALKRLTSLVGHCRAFVFSDDHIAARTLLTWPEDTVFVPGNPNLPHEDLHIMRSCHHHILANSSLSWWSARLRYRTSGVVIAPGRWYAADTPANATICPAEWVRMPDA